MIDTHFHILPGIDDGPADMAESMVLARLAADDGTRVIAATSHVDHGFDVEASQLAPARDEVRAALRDAGIDVEVVRGGEIALSRLVDLDDEELADLRLGDGDVLLVECPFTLAMADMEPLVRGLRSRGYRMMLAHPERCPAFQREPDRLRSLVEAGALAQVTAGSLRGDFGRTVRRFAATLLREGNVHCLASDAHDALQRPPGLHRALEEGERDVPGLAALEDWLCRDVPEAVLAGREIPSRPSLPEAPRRGLVARVLRRA